MGYISLPPNLNAMTGIISYYCVIPQMMIRHDSIKKFQNGIFVFLFYKKNKTLFFSKHPKNKLKKSRRFGFLKKTGFS